MGWGEVIINENALGRSNNNNVFGSGTSATQRPNDPRSTVFYENWKQGNKSKGSPTYLIWIQKFLAFSRRHVTNVWIQRGIGSFRLWIKLKRSYATQML
uniref:Uncharacterized protein n=1 Tax=Meloidogyne enterolobii TaxID=390850 RepID=A0A6V7XT56_MELEN|nr:unnamed protein product [Meloidogyne enterolobii]